MIGGVGWNGGRPVYPGSGPNFLAQAGLSVDSLWTFDEASGDVLDKVGTNHLSAIVTPTYDVKFQGRRGITYDSTSANRISNALQPGLNSMIFGVAFWIPAFDPVSNYLVMGLSNGAVSPGICLGIAAVSGDAFIWVKDAVAPQLQISSAFTQDALTRPRMFFGIIQVDRAANNGQMLICDGTGDYDLQTGSIAGFLTLTLAGQSFGCGARGFIGGTGTTFGFARIGVDAEGAGLPLQLAQRLRWV